jgi:hypothetical protein
VIAISLLSQRYPYCHSNIPIVTATPLLSQQYPYCHSNIHTVTATPLLSQQYPYCHSNTPTVTAISLLSQQYPYSHSNIPIVTAIPLLPQQYPYCHSNISTVTAISLLSQQYPYCHSNIPTVTAISLLSQQYPYCHTQFQALQCAHSWQVQHTKNRKFTGDRTANTKRNNQYGVQFQAFCVMFCSRHSSVSADQLVLSTVLGTLDSGPSALSGITECEMLFQGDYNSDGTTYKTSYKTTGVSVNTS